MSIVKWNSTDELLDLIDSLVNKLDFDCDDLVNLVHYMIEYYVEMNYLTITKSNLLLFDLNYTISMDENIARLTGLESIDFSIHSLNLNRDYNDSFLLVLKNAVVKDVLVHLNLSSYYYMCNFNVFHPLNLDFLVSESLYIDNNKLFNCLLSLDKFSLDTLYDNYFESELRKKLFIFLLNNNHIDAYLDIYFFDEFLEDMEEMFSDELVDISNLSGYFISDDLSKIGNSEENIISLSKVDILGKEKTSLNLPQIDFRLYVIDNLLMTGYDYIFLEKKTRLIKQHRFSFMKSVTLCMYYDEVVNLVDNFDDVIIYNLDNYAKFDIYLHIENVDIDSPLIEINHPYLKIN